MATIYKILGQVNPAANTLTAAYTVPGGSSTVISTIVICNQLSSSAAFRIAVQPEGITATARHYIAYDSVIVGNDSITLTIGMTLSSTDVISVYASTSTTSFNIFGSEMS